MIKLNEKDKKTYERIIESGTMEDMFRFAALVGYEQCLRENIDKLSEIVNI